LYFAAGEMYEIIKISQALFTSYVLLRKTQSSVSLRLTALSKGAFLRFPPRRTFGGEVLNCLQVV
jgi:hypothetical protein